MLNIMSHGGTRETLELAVLPTFCSQWMIPRIKSFYQRNPDVTINMSAHSVMFLFQETAFDAAIHFGQPTWPGTVADYLFNEEVIAVSNPDLLPDGKLSEAEDILNYPILHLTSRQDAWHHWFQNADVSSTGVLQGARYEHFSILISAACAGLGIALIPRFLIAEELEKKQLTIVYDLPLQSNDAYYLVYPEENLASNALQHFKEWILGEINT